MLGEQSALREMAKKLGNNVHQQDSIHSIVPKNRIFVEEIPDRRKETVKTAISMGYYEYPKDALTDIADKLDLKQATVSEHLQRGR